MKRLLGSIILAAFGVIGTLGLAAYQPVQPAPTAAACGEILGIPAWYTGLQKGHATWLVVATKKSFVPIFGLLS